VIADPGGNFTSEFGRLGAVAIPEIAGLAAEFVKADQRMAFRFT
jgi:hypothetical protein